MSGIEIVPQHSSYRCKTFRTELHKTQAGACRSTRGSARVRCGAGRATCTGARTGSRAGVTTTAQAWRRTAVGSAASGYSDEQERLCWVRVT